MNYFASIKFPAVMILAVSSSASWSASQTSVSDDVISKQRETLAANAIVAGFGPQSPRDLDNTSGNNAIEFALSPASEQMNLCNIHFHKNAEHKGGEFTEYAGNGDGHGFNSGYRYNGKLTKAESKPFGKGVCASEHSVVQSGDTIELHYVYSSAQVEPGATLGACVKSPILNPQLRVEAQVFVVVNDPDAADFQTLTKVGKLNDRPQAINIPADTGTPVQYAGSTTGPSYNEAGSPYQVTWNVRPAVKKVNIASVGKWCEQNEFSEDHAHGVRNLVQNVELLAPIGQ